MRRFASRRENVASSPPPRRRGPCGRRANRQAETRRSVRRRARRSQAPRRSCPCHRSGRAGPPTPPMPVATSRSPPARPGGAHRPRTPPEAARSRRPIRSLGRAARPRSTGTPRPERSGVAALRVRRTRGDEHARVALLGEGVSHLEVRQHGRVRQTEALAARDGGTPHDRQRTGPDDPEGHAH